MISIDAVFGPPKRSDYCGDWNPLIVIRHGFNSDERPFEPLKALLNKHFPRAYVHNRPYDWHKSVFYNGTAMAYGLLQKPEYKYRDLVFIGHSMGGLVCRLANAVLSDQAFRSVASTLGLNEGYSGSDVTYFQSRAFANGVLRHVSGMITLATPNSGAMLQGQVSGIAGAVQGLLNYFPPTRVSSIGDLTTGRIFRLLEAAKINTPTLSISGSRWSRFALASGQLSQWTGLVGINLDMPHDSIVEDRSVDLNSSILPNEVVHHGRAPYQHLRAYDHCTEVSHTNIYLSPSVHKYLIEFLRRM